MIKVFLYQLVTIFMLALFLQGCGKDSATEKELNGANFAPTANAGSDQLVNEQTLVTLTGSGTDRDGSITHYQWTQESGITVPLFTADEAIASFTAPSVSSIETIVFKFSATDNEGGSTTDTVRITITPADSVLLTSIVFNDSKLNSCVLNHASENAWVLSREMTSLDCSRANISDLTGLEKLTNLKTLNLASNQIIDISPLASLVSLVDLDLDNNQIFEITELMSLALIKSLNIASNQLSNITTLFNLVNATSINLLGNDAIFCINLSTLESIVGIGVIIRPDECVTSDNQKWAFITDGILTTSAAIGADGTIYLGASDSKLYAINPDGSQKWVFATGGIINSSPSIGALGTIYVGSDDNNLYAVNPDGSQRWIYATSGDVNSSATIAPDGTIYIGSEDNKLYAVNPNGNLKWSFLTGDDVNASAAIASDGTIYIGSADHSLYALNPDGSLLWSFATGGDVNSPAAISTKGAIYVSSDDGNLYAINPDGSQQWSFFTNGIENSSTAVAVDGTIYLGTSDGNVFAISPSGIQKWIFDAGDRVKSTPAIADDGTIIVGSFDNNVYAINPDGSQKWVFSTTDIVISSPAIAPDGSIYIGSHDRILYSINSTSGGLANSVWPKFGQNNHNTGQVPKSKSFSARYRVTFSTPWTASTFATNYPSLRHFSQLVGSTHNTQGEFWKLGTSASFGVQRMAEVGSIYPLYEEINEQILAGKSQNLIIGGGIGLSSTQVSLEFDITADFSLLSLVSMVAPSPDWFVAVNSLPLRVNGSWIDQVTVGLKVYDAGSDDGTRFDSLNQESLPHVAISELTSEVTDTDILLGTHRQDPTLTLANFHITRID